MTSDDLSSLWVVDFEPLNRSFGVVSLRDYLSASRDALLEQRISVRGIVEIGLSEAWARERADALQAERNSTPCHLANRRELLEIAIAELSKSLLELPPSGS